MKRFATFAVTFLPIVGFLGFASADELTTAQNMMEAASIVLSEFAGFGGHVALDSDASAHFVFNAESAGVDVHFKKLSNCTFGMSEKYQSGTTAFVFISFDKFAGTFSSNGEDLFFDGSKRAACSRRPNGQMLCWDGLPIYGARYQQRIVDDVAYLARHGCGNSDPGPH